MRSIPVNFKNKSNLIIFFLLLAVHGLLIFHQFPLKTGIEGDIPLRGDVSRYFATAWGTAKLDALYGYDTDFMAGYPVGLWNSMGRKGFEMLHVLFPAVPLSLLFYWAMAGLVFFSPLALFFAVRFIQSEERYGNMFLFLILIFWHFSTQLSYFWHVGNVFWPSMSCFLVVLFLLIYHALYKKASLIAAGLIGLVAAIIFYGHTVLLIPFIIPLAYILVSAFPNLRFKHMTAIAVAATVFFVLTLWWLFPLLSHREHMLSQPALWFQGGIKYAIMDLFSDRAFGHAYDRNALFQAVLILAGYAMIRVQDRRGMIWHLGVAGFLFILFAFFGQYTPLKSVQPYRFLVPGGLFLLAPAMYGLSIILDQLKKMDSEYKTVVILISLMLVPRFSAYIVDDVSGDTPSMGTTMEQRRLIQVVKKLPDKGRVMIDDIPLGDILPSQTGKAVLGGLSMQSFLEHTFSGFNDEGGLFFGRLPKDWNKEDFKQYLDEYAVDYAVLRKPDWVHLAESWKDIFKPLEYSAPYHIYKIGDRQASFIKGNGTLSVTPQKLIVTEVNQSDIILRFHYAVWLRATNGVVLQPVTLLDDPVPFVRAIIPSGVNSFEVMLQPNNFREKI